LYFIKISHALNTRILKCFREMRVADFTF